MPKDYIVKHHLKLGGKVYEPTLPGKTVKLDLTPEIEAQLTRADGSLEIAKPTKIEPVKPDADQIDAAVAVAAKNAEGKKPTVKAVEALLKADITAADLDASWERLKKAA